MVILKQFQDDVVDAIIDLLIEYHVIADISQIQKIVSSDTGQITTGSYNGIPIILYQEDYQVVNQNFMDIMAVVSQCYYDEGSGEYNIFDGSVLGWDSDGGPLVLFDLPSYNGGCASQQIPAAEILYVLSQLVTFDETTSEYDISQAIEVLDTNIRELLPSGLTRQEQINRFFTDYQNLKPPNPPQFDEEISGLLLEEDSDNYDFNNSISSDKYEGYITRLNENTDDDNIGKTLQWMRDDLSLYLRDLDVLGPEQWIDGRPEYENSSKGYLKIRNLNQSIIIRKEEGDDVGLIGSDESNPLWLDEGFTVTMWVKFLDRVNSGTLFNFGNPISDTNPYGFMLETYVLNKNELIRPDEDDPEHSYYQRTWGEWINERTEGSSTLLDQYNSDAGGTSTPPFPDYHTFFKLNDYERFVRLIVNEPDVGLRDSHVGTSRWRGQHLATRRNTIEDGIATVDNWTSRLLNTTRVPIDFNEWFFICANYNPSIQEDESFIDGYFSSYGPSGLTTLRYDPDFWRNNVIPLNIEPTESQLEENPYNADSGYGLTTCDVEGIELKNCLVGEYTHSSGYGAKCKVELISRSDLLRAKGFKI